MLNITPEVERQVRRGIRRLLTERNISMRRLAKQANIPQTSLYYFLTGKYRYRHVYALAIAQVLGVSVEELARIGAEETCPLCGGTGEYDESFEALCNMPAQELKEYAGEAWDASLSE